MNMSDVEVLFKKGKRTSAAFIHSECIQSTNGEQRMLSQISSVLFDVNKSIADWDTIDWIRWIISSGKTPEEFSLDVKRYDNATKCGLVWTANFVAYRCRTCGISPCMSLCAECFKKGNHEGHDFNMFRSQAGGACDCGDDSVMKEQGFCVHHGSKVQTSIPTAPADLLCVARAIMPRVIHRLILHLRINSIKAIEEADVYIKDLLLKLTEMGAAMRSILSDTLTNPNLYSSLANACDSKDLGDSEVIRQRIDNYTRAKRAMPHFKIPVDSDEFRIVSDIVSFQSELVHKSFLEELLFWTIVYEFPQKLVCFLLNMLPDEKYKEAFAETFVYHYSRISIMLCQSRANDRNSRPKDNIHDILSNCVVHVSVQLFSNEELAVKLCQRTQLLYVIVISLKYPIEGCADEDDISGILMSNPMQDPKKNAHNVVRCDHHILKEHRCWPIVSDLNNVLTHRPVALMFINDCALLDFWLELIMAFQGMNLNQRELSEHVEYENNAYYSAFTAELEICATPMWTLICHLKDSDSGEQSIQIIKHVMHWLETWFELIAFEKDDIPNPMQSTFHLPLHRYLSVFVQHAVSYQNVSLSEVLPPEDVLKQLLAHPLQTLVSFYEILCGLWVRNGLQIKGQAMTYIQCNFSNSMVDPDLFLIQQVATHVESDWFIQTVFERFHVWDCLSLGYSDMSLYKGFLEPDQIMPMLEGALTHIATLLSVHNNLGMTEEQVTRKEMVTLLAMGDKTHSQLMDLLPEKCGTQASQNTYFESTLSKISEFKQPVVEVGGSLFQGQFYPKAEIWINEYDPIHVLLRAVHRRDYQSSMDRFAQFARQSGKFKSTSQPWPPFRIPPAVDSNKFVDPRKLLHSKVLHGVIFCILYKAVYFHEIPDQILALTIYLLDMAIKFPSPVSNTNDSSLSSTPNEVNDLHFSEWFPSNWIMSSLITPVKNVKLPERRVSYDGAVEEMEVDEDTSDSPEEDDQYMSDEEEQPYEVHSPATSEAGEGRSLESSIQRPQLPSVTVPLALPPPPNTATSSALVPLSLESRQIASTNSSNSTVVSSMGSQASSSRLTRSFSLPASRPLRATADSADTTTNNDEMSVVASSIGPARLRSRNHRLRCVRPNDQRLLLINRRRHGRVFEPDSQSCQMDYQSSQQTRSNQPHLVVSELMKALPPSSGILLPINETIISLLIRLHSKLSGKPDSYKPTKLDQLNESRIGDGPFFIEQLLNQFIQLNVNGEQIINDIRNKIWPPQTSSTKDSGNSSPKSEEMDREERRRRAKERQQKLMAEFASKQKAFMKNLEEEMNFNMSDDQTESSSDSSPSFLLQSKEYECVICGQSGPTTNEKLFGQVVLLQSTSVLGHSTIDCTKPSKVPNSEEEVICLQHRKTLAKFMEEKIDEFDRYFDKNSWLNSFNIGWVGGVHVQSCGHYLHIDCHKSYMQSLRGVQQVQNRFGIEQGEYSCPLCRQLANSVLPINPSMGEIGAIVKCRPNDINAVANEIFDLLSSISHPDSELLKLLGNAIEDLTKATGPQFRNIRVTPSAQSLFLFLCSITRTNLESDLLIKKSKSIPCGAKKSCFVPLFHVLALNAKVVISIPYDNLWSQLTGLTLEEHKLSLTTIEKEVPLLLKDVSSILIQIFYALPLNVDKAYFTTVVQTLFNLNFIQALAQLSYLMTERQRIELKELSLKSTNHFDDLTLLIGFIIDMLEDSYEDDSSNKFWSNFELVEGVVNICLPFLRLAAMLEHHLYSEPFPELADDINEEFNTLVQYLSLGTSPVGNTGCVDEHSITKSLNWTCEQPKQLIQTWSQDYTSKSLIAARKLLRNTPIVWKRPSLLRLPPIYDQLFMFYHQRQCRVCNKVPKDPSICLVCGTLVCMRESCCRTESGLEAVTHSNICGAGTAIYLACNSSTVIVIRGKRACVWGSVYLDGFGEEDRDLKRGKPLYLSDERYWILEQQWLTHSFDHTNKRWVNHKDTL